MAEEEMVESEEQARQVEAQTRRAAAKLTDRDRDLLGLLVLARYLAVPQVHELAFPGKHLSLAYRRLLKLSQEGEQPAFVRQRFFRTYDGNRVAVWAPTLHALPAALARAPQLPELPKHDVGAQFLEHLIQLNKLFVALWANGTQCPRAENHRFRWVPSDRVRLTWGEYEQREGRQRERIIQPDAVLEVVTHRRRYFLECEMGTQMISPGTGNAPGATVSKADRYERFLCKLAGGSIESMRTYYDAQYPDGFAPEVLFLVLTEGRAASVNAALAEWQKRTRPRTPFPIRALTFEAATAYFRSMVGLPPRSTTAVAKSRSQGAQGLSLRVEDVELLYRCVGDALTTIKGARRTFRMLGRDDLPQYPTTGETAWRFLQSMMQRAQRLPSTTG